MADNLLEIGAFNESGRGLPIYLSRPGPALPFSPLVQQAYAPTPRARIGWAAGLLECRDVALDEPWGIAPADKPSLAARRLLDEEVGWVAVLDGARFLGVVWAEDLLGCVAGDRFPSSVRPLMSAQIPTCAPTSALVDAVRQMLAAWIRRIPVVGDHGELTGILSLSAAAQSTGRDPAVRDLLESATPAIFARRWR
jgi:CBS-domain-containing membrane protein